MESEAVFIVLLEFADKSRAAEHIEEHQAWIEQGFSDDVFIMAGSIPDRGGTVMAVKQTAKELAERVDRDPFVREGVVTAEIVEVLPSRTHPVLKSVVTAEP